MSEGRPVEPSRIADLLEASATIVVAELEALGTDGGWRPEAGEWSANECVGLLVEAETRGFAGRIRQILAADPGHPAALVSGIRRRSPGLARTTIATTSASCSR